MVWLTAVGLTVGVLLTVGLLGLIVVKGLESFWPRKLMVLEVERNGQLETMAGYLVQERSRKDISGEVHKEIQLFRGNRELYGEKFIFLDRKAIQSEELGEGLLLIERLEGGNVIGKARSLKFADGKELSAEADDFEEQLNELLKTNKKRRAELERVEKREIGKLSKRERELKHLQKIEGEDAARAAELEELAERYAVLDQERGEIRELLESDELHIEAVSGQSIKIPSGEVLHVFAPNEASFLARVGETFYRGWTFLISNPREANTEGGVFPAIFGTVLMTIIMSVFVTPFGVIAAIYLREYAKQGPLVRAVRISVNNLAGVPSIVFGVFGLAFFIYFVGGIVDSTFYPNSEEPVYKSGGILWASLTLALLTVPVVIVATEEALAAVPRGVREAALACGASKWQTIQRVVLPASLPGILTGVILAMARGAGEVAPLMLVGVVKSAPDLPLDATAPFIHPERQFMHLGFHIYDLGFQSPDSEAAKPMVFATTLLLIVLVVVINLCAIMIRNRLRKKFATSSF